MTVSRRVQPSGRLWNPAADVYRTNSGWVVKLDLAGICSDDVVIEVGSSTLRISGCRRDTFYREGLVYHQMEITYSRFEKLIQFPCELKDASMDHRYSDGFLIIDLSCK